VQKQLEAMDARLTKFCRRETGELILARINSESYVAISEILKKKQHIHTYNYGKRTSMYAYYGKDDAMQHNLINQNQNPTIN
jgi:hypothetical protein